MNGLYDCDTSDVDLTILFDDEKTNLNHLQVLKLARSILEHKHSDLAFTNFNLFWQQSGAILKFKVTQTSEHGIPRTFDVDL